MGKYNKGILGRFRGKVGNVVGAVWNGVSYMRSLGDYVDNPSTAQLNARAKVSLMMPFLAEIKSLINPGWASKEKKGLTAMNAASSYHLKYAVTGVAPSFSVAYPEVIFSVGDLDGVQDPDVATGTVGTSVDFTWTPQVYADPGEAALRATDKATVLVYCATKDKFVYVKAAALRSAGSYSLNVPAAFGGEMVQCWMGFVSADARTVSDSVYIGAVPVA